MGGDAGLVEPQQHRLRFDAHDPHAHEVWEAMVEIAVEVDPVEAPHGIDDAIGLGSGDLHLAIEHAAAQRGARGGETHDRGDVLETGPTSAFLIASEQQRAQPQATSHEQRADTGRTTELVRAHRQQIGVERSEVDGHVAVRLRGVDVDEHASLATRGDDLLDRLDRADLVIAPLDVYERGVVGDGRRDLVRVHPARGVDTDLDNRAARLACEGGRRFTDG